MRIDFKLTALLCTVALFATILISNWNTVGAGNQWDFRAHFFSVKAYDMGLNPYSHKDINSVNTTPYPIPAAGFITYHPVTYTYYRLFTWLPYDTAYPLYMGFLALLLVLLITLWYKYFLEQVNIILFTLILTFSFNCAFFLPIDAGNLAIFEAVVTWLGLLAFIRNKPWIFLIAIAGIAFFKGMPILLTPLVFLLPGRGRNLVPFVSVLLVSGLIWISPLIYMPELFHSYLAHLASLQQDLGIINPSSFALITDILQLAGHENAILKYCTYLAWMITAVGSFIMVVRNLDWEKYRKEIAFLAMLTYALISMRFADYAYLQLIPIAYFLVTRNPELIFVDLFRLLTPNVALPFLLKEYHPFFAALINWGYLAFLIYPRNNATHLKLQVPGREGSDIRLNQGPECESASNQVS